MPALLHVCVQVPPPPRQCCIETALSLPGQWGHPCLQKSCRLVTEKECLLIKSSKVEDMEPMFKRMGLDFLATLGTPLFLNVLLLHLEFEGSTLNFCLVLIFIIIILIFKYVCVYAHVRTQACMCVLTWVWVTMDARKATDSLDLEFQMAEIWPTWVLENQSWSSSGAMYLLLTTEPSP